MNICFVAGPVLHATILCVAATIGASLAYALVKGTEWFYGRREKC